MNRKSFGIMMMGVVLLVSTATALAQHTENAKMVLDSTDQACLQLKDSNQWTTYASDVSGVGTKASLATVLTNLDDNAIELTSGTHPNVVGYDNGIQWDSTDQGTAAWIPQGLTAGTSGSTDYVMVSWHWNTDNYSYDNGSRISIINNTSLASATYRNVILVKPTGVGTYESVNLHVGGIAVAGNYLYVADTSHGFRVFDLTNFRDVDGDSTLCKNTDGSGIFGEVGTNWCADGYGYMLPEVDEYTIPTTKSDGTTIPASCKPKFSWVGNDTRPTTQLIISGEYCNNTDTYCNSDSDGLNGRLYQWPLGSDNKLVTSSLYVTPKKVYYMNQRNMQGVAPDMVAGAATDSYWVGGTRDYGSIVKASPTATAKYWYYGDSQAPWHVEGMHATTSSGHLWMVTEGDMVGTAPNEYQGTTNPATEGRVVIYIDQSAVN